MESTNIVCKSSKTYTMCLRLILTIWELLQKNIIPSLPRYIILLWLNIRYELVCHFSCSYVARSSTSSLPYLTKNQYLSHASCFLKYPCLRPQLSLPHLVASLSERRGDIFQLQFFLYPLQSNTTVQDRSGYSE